MEGQGLKAEMVRWSVACSSISPSPCVTLSRGRYSQSLQLRVAPVSLLCTASNIFLCKSLGSLSRTLILSIMDLLIDCFWCWLRADLEPCFSIDFPCSSTLSPSHLPGSPTYNSPHTSQAYSYMTPHCSPMSRGSLGLTTAFLIVKPALEYREMSCFLKVLCSLSVTPSMYGRTAYCLLFPSST